MTSEVGTVKEEPGCKVPVKRLYSGSALVFSPSHRNARKELIKRLAANPDAPEFYLAISATDHDIRRYDYRPAQNRTHRTLAVADSIRLQRIALALASMRTSGEFPRDHDNRLICGEQPTLTRNAKRRGWERITACGVPDETSGRYQLDFLTYRDDAWLATHDYPEPLNRC